MTFNLHEMVFTCDYPGEKKMWAGKKVASLCYFQFADDS